MTRRRDRLIRAAAGALLLAALLALGWRLFGPRGTWVDVETRHWQRDIEVERLVLESASAWCDELPAQARDVERRWLEDPQGQRGRAEHCRYQLPQWRPRRSAHAEGGQAHAPHWPAEPVLDPAQERLGKRHERYELRLRTETGQTWHCELPQARWQRFHEGQRLRLAVDRHGVADCGRLPG